MSFVVAELLRKKRDGRSLSKAELAFLVDGFAKDSIPDYQTSAFLMAAFLRGLDGDETLTLTRCMKESGRFLDWRKLNSAFKDARFADKHSTGGVGDKVSLILAPLAAGLGVKVPMMSGRGLGHTGGTLDKLQSIAGFNVFPETAAMIKCLDETGMAMMGQSADICPADKKLYALRDVTGTIESVPLITASIVSKKWAEGVDAIVYDVKCGSAAFMSSPAGARELARSLVKTSSMAGMKALACITRMDEALGSCIGNALEVKESLWILSDRYPSAELKRLARPLRDLSCQLAARMAVTAGSRPDLKAAVAECEKALSDGSALKLFERMAVLQGATKGWQESLARTSKSFTLKAPRAGVVAAIHSRALGVAGLKIGVGRQRVEDKIDPATGFEMRVAPGDRIEKGQALLLIHVHRSEDAAALESELLAAFEIGEKDPPAAALLIEEIAS